MFEILAPSVLPVKSIVRFKSVSKQWYSTISSHNLAVSQLQKSPLPNPLAPVDTLFIKGDNNYYLFSYDDDQPISHNFGDNLVKLDLMFDVGDSSLEFTGCCNGLVCLTACFGEYFIVWNPATGKVHKYESDENSEVLKLSRPEVISGFGYVSSIDDYIYVRIIVTYDSPSKEDAVIAHVFSLRKKEWRRIKFDFDPDTRFIYGQPVFVDEMMYWAGYDSKEEHRLLVYFDFGLESFGTISYSGQYMTRLGLVGDCLGLFSERMALSLQCVMKSPEKVKWFCNLPEDFAFDVCSEFVGFTRTGKVLFTSPVNDEGDESHNRSRMLGLIDPGSDPTVCSMISSRQPMVCSRLLRFRESSVNIAKYVPSLESPLPMPELPEA